MPWPHLQNTESELQLTSPHTVLRLRKTSSCAFRSASILLTLSVSNFISSGTLGTKSSSMALPISCKYRALRRHAELGLSERPCKHTHVSATIVEISFTNID